MKELKLKINVHANNKELLGTKEAFVAFNKSVDGGSKSVVDFNKKFKDSVDLYAHASQAIVGWSAITKAAFGSVSAPMANMVRISADFERQKSILKVLEGDAQGAEKSFEWIKEFAANVRECIKCK